MDLSTLYHPITSTPFRRDRGYSEAPPSAALRPYVRCFWRQLPRRIEGEAATLVIPDTCMDLIFHIGASGMSQRFCAINDRSFLSEPVPQTDTFGIRFYPWAAAFFTEDTLLGSRNGLFDAEWHFPALTRALTRMLRETDGFPARCERAEALLLESMRPHEPSPVFLNAIYETLRGEGRPRTEELARNVHVSVRQLERLFNAYTGVSPKRLGSLVRYQCLWREAALDGRFDVQDAVERFGFTDQSHLLRQFKTYHSLSLKEAIVLAGKDVAFLQADFLDL